MDDKMKLVRGLLPPSIKGKVDAYTERFLDQKGQESVKGRTQGTFAKIERKEDSSGPQGT